LSARQSSPKFITTTERSAAGENSRPDGSGDWQGPFTL
jgi:hypothetical protein